MAWLTSLLRQSAHLIFILVCSTHACSNPPAQILSTGDGKNVRTVFIIHDAWHSAVVIRTADISAAVLPEMKDFPSAEYLEFSWGDRDYFTAPDGGLGLALKAAFWSSGSVLHVVGFRDTMKNTFPSADIIELVLSDDGFQRLIKFISDSFSRPHPPTPADPRPGLFPNGRFYSAEGKFSISRTCNTWVAEALRAAGLPISPSYVITAGNLDNQVRHFATRK